MSELEIELRCLKETLEAKREEWRSGSFLDAISLNETHNISNLRYALKLHFQKTRAELEELEDRYESLKEELKNEYRESINSAADVDRLNNSTDIFKITVRRNYVYDESYLKEKAKDKDIDPNSFYKVTTKFDPRLVPDELKEDLKQAKSLKGITTSFKDKTG